MIWNRMGALQVLAGAAIITGASGCQLYNRYMPGRRAHTVSNLERVPPAMPAEPAPSNDAIEKAARRLAGSGAKNFGRLCIDHTQAVAVDFDDVMVRRVVGLRAVDAFKAKEPFVLIHDDLNWKPNRKARLAVSRHEALVLTPQGQLMRLSTSATEGAQGPQKLRVQKVKRLVWKPSLAVPSVEQLGAE